jgi:2'-5' RNA ligase
VPEPQRAELGRFREACAAAAPQFRWTPPENLHFTMRFIGSVDRSLVEGIAARLVQRPLRAFQLELGEVGTFNRGRLARVVWLGARSGVEEASELARQVEEECVAAGLEPEGRKFTAHLTLARARPREGAVLPALPAAPQLAPWQASELVLYSSRLGRTGSVYEVLRRVDLQ